MEFLWEAIAVVKNVIKFRAQNLPTINLCMEPTFVAGEQSTHLDEYKMFPMDRRLHTLT
jgi:hypothetical protein